MPTLIIIKLRFVAGDKMPEELADEFIREADLNGDGKIDYQGEFLPV
jgi:Ca2+-binding EF-hand superfamily protein